MSAADQPGPSWPSPFGADDQHGMLNLVTGAERRDALGQVRHGRLYDLGLVHLLDRIGVSLPEARVPAQPAGAPA